MYIINIHYLTQHLLQKKRMTGENYVENKKAQSLNSNIVMNKW